MSSKFTRSITKVAVAQACQTIGWHAIQTTPLEVLTDVFQKYFHELIDNIRRHTEFFGRTEPILEDITLAFNACGISIEELEEYVSQVAPVPCTHPVPKYPIDKESHLNLLKPGSREVVTRPVHIHEHLPAMHPQLEEEDYSKITPISVDTNVAAGNSPESSPKSMFKKPVDPPSESAPHKRIRMLAEEEGRPLREISSVMMTTSGFLSPAREGKLPEAKALPKLSSLLNESESPSYPTVPPEVKGDKKHKKSSAKQGSSGSKKPFDKDKAKENGMDSKEKNDLFSVNNDSSDTKVKKLAGMKETGKLKAFKTGAFKLSQNNTNDPNAVKFKDPLLSQSLQVLLPKLPKLSKSKSPVPSAPKPETSSEKSKAGDKSKSVFEGKLAAEPDRQKLNIFKKISSKPKEEKQEDGSFGNDRKVDMPSPTPKNRNSPLPSADSYDSLPLPKTPDIPTKLVKTKNANRKRGRPKGPDEASPPKPPRKKAKVKTKTSNIPTDDFNPAFPFGTNLPRVGLFPHPLLNFPLPGSKNFPPTDIPGLPKVLNPLHGVAVPSASSRDELNVLKPKDKQSPESSKASMSQPKTIPSVAEDKPATPADKVKESKTLSPSSGTSIETSVDGEGKDKKKDHKKDKKHKKRKHKEKLKLREKLKEKAKILKKEKEKRKEKKDKPEAADDSAVPKLTLKLETDAPATDIKPPTPTPIPETSMKKIVIKPVMKKESESVAMKLEKGDETVTPPKKSKVKSQSKKPSDVNSRKSSVALSDVSTSDASVPKVSVKFKQTPNPQVPVASVSSVETPPAASAAQYPFNSSLPNPQKFVELAEQIKNGKEVKPFYFDPSGAQIWICPACGRQDDGTPMIGCDGCDAWYHWSCLGLKVAPDSTKWFCPVCSILKSQKGDKKKKPGRKKKGS
nr:PREDICTED: transcription initiation factor TFIID subunit 3 [Bemisia tabaci]